MGDFSLTERETGYEAMKTKIYEFMEKREMDPLMLAIDALSWFREKAQIDRFNRIAGV